MDDSTPKRPVIERLIVKRFRSIPSEQIEFDNPLFLVGQNGSGKSNVADAFAFLAEAMTSPLQAVFDNRGGISTVRNRTSGSSYPPNLGLGVRFGPIGEDIVGGHYAFEIAALPEYGFRVKREQCIIRRAGARRVEFDRKDTNFTSSVAGLNPAIEPSSLCLPLVGGDARFAPIFKTLATMRVYSIEPEKLRQLQEPDSGVSLRRDGSNAASVLEDIRRSVPSDFDRIAEMLSSIVPNTKEVRAVRHANKISLKFTQEWGSGKRLKFEGFNMSDGTLRALGLLTAVHQHPSPSLIVIEEPEATIHPGALGAILDLVHIASKRMQVVVTTHSPDLLDAARWIEDRHLRIVSWHEGATHIGPIGDAPREALRGHLMGAGELLRSNVLRAPDLFELIRPGQQNLFEDAP